MSNPGKKDIWSAILEDKKKRESGDSTDKDGGKIESKTNSEDKHESYILVVGSKGSGKTTHIAHFLSSGGGPENPKSTTALEYKYGRRVVSTKKQLVNVWELGGGTSLKDLSNIPLIPQRLPTAAVCIVLNLEKPGSIINSLAFWLQVVRERASTVFADIEKNKPQVAEELRQKIQRPYVNNVDMKAGLLDLSYVPMVVVLTHHDEFVKEDPVKRKVLLQAVRFMCHTFGASLICGGNPTTKNPSILHFRSILNRHAFRVDTKMSKQVEISKPCIVHAGKFETWIFLFLFFFFALIVIKRSLPFFLFF
eukprot:TRINITY_DN66489_c0_g1_i1.p1 TRINITY_DN66489_c0_g1~~TRINITY_DN66489_c0_g1_i1.p1  ORF type:complete len:308 (+),score=51.21 TRINITY_DN66489_c0_g1_i1:52-975(+)